MTNDKCLLTLETKHASQKYREHTAFVKRNRQVVLISHVAELT